MEDENADYLLLGIENQTEIHYAMPVRNMIYDALQYGNQVAAIAAQNVKEKKAPTRAEFLSGFYKADKLRPVITLVLHFGADPWDGATSLHEMMDFPLEEMRTFIQDYKIHLIDPAALEPDAVSYTHLKIFIISNRPVLSWSDTVSPVINIRIASARPADHRRMQLLKRIHKIFADSMIIRNLRILTDPDAIVNTRTKKFYKVSLQLRVNITLSD